MLLWRNLAALLCVLTVAAAHPTALGASVAPPGQVKQMCTGFGAICKFVAAECDPTAGSLDPKCVESFQLYYQHNYTLSACDREIDNGPALVERELMVAFLERYNVWQTAHVCDLFHSTEAKAAHECSGPNVHRPWNEDTWPLFCHNAFMTYNATRHELDALCERTSDSDAFWEGYVEYIASGTCKQYYSNVRAAIRRDCGAEDRALHDEACVDMFQWYTQRQNDIERDCFELQVSKTFYRGFYTWKKRRHEHR